MMISTKAGYVAVIMITEVVNCEDSVFLQAIIAARLHFVFIKE